MSPQYTIILAAGKGTRMKSDQIPKVCFEVNGTPAILRAMDSYTKTGVSQFIVVVGGSLSAKVIDTVSSRYSNVVYACQREQNGTADAVACAINGLTTIADDEDLLVVAGDRLIDTNILEQFYEKHYSSKADFSLLALEKHTPSSAGHILNDADGIPMAIVEMADIRQRRTFAKLQQAVASYQHDTKILFSILCENFFSAEATQDAKKGTKAFGKLWTLLEDPNATYTDEISELIKAGKNTFSFDTPKGKLVFTPEEAEASPLRNNSVYIVKAGILRKALKSFTKDNAQQEIYLSDILNAVYRDGLENGTIKTALQKVDDEDKILGFNNPSELMEVEQILRKAPGRDLSKREPGLFKPLKVWKELFASSNDKGSEFHAKLTHIYGDDEDVIARQSAEMLKLAENAEKAFSLDTPLMFVRAPGRLNTMGRHVDHQGGNCNLMTISFETMMFVAERNDDIVSLSHCNQEDFQSETFKISELMAELPWEDWETVINSPKLAQRIKEKGISWTDYIRAAILRVQKKYKSVQLSGMDILVNGNIPMAAGLSSSSSLIVCMTEALVHLNNLTTFPTQFIALCGEGEWFVGTHGGSADHAAVKMGGRGSITKVRFFDFAIDKSVPFPDGYAMVVCDSGIKARKSSNAKDQFNHRVACYKLGFELIKRYCPQYSGVLHYLRDVNKENLHVPLRQIYKILLMLPENPTRSEIEQMLPDMDLQRFFAGHDSNPDRHYPIRSVVMYGLCEMQRSAKFADAFAKSDLAALRRMLKNSHDGDRVVCHDASLNEIPHVIHTSNTDLMELMDDLESGDVERVQRAQLEEQSGGYGCSIPEIDLMVDIADRTPGVVGAQLAGAGLGGCMMILVKQDAIPLLQDNLKRLYYDKFDRPPRILTCRPVAGAGVIL